MKQGPYLLKYLNRPEQTTDLNQNPRNVTTGQVLQSVTIGI